MITLNIKKENGRLYLYVNAKEFHDRLDQIGAPSNEAVYADRPRAAYAVCDRSTFTLSTDVLLNKSYPAKYDLSAIYTEPVNVTNLQKLLDSALDQAHKIQEHYQPIDIFVSIQKKVDK
jgi:hypothetical protein